MKRIFKIILIFSLTLVITSCTSNKEISEDKYTMNASYSLGGEPSRTEITYEIVISGTKENIENIDAYEILINEEYSELMLKNGPHNAQKEIGEESYLLVNGGLIFDTSDHSKKAIDEMNLLQGIKIIDKNSNEEILKFNKN